MPGADQAITAGTLSHQLSTMLPSAAPMEIAQIHEAIISWDTWALCAAWKKITAGPA
ncbi:hypothetical protein D3C78_1644180 [compost metagenome]